ncbi:hypothetical protein NE237_027949 [Protea cynaroides]|uniref:Non-reducing end beta-L-arabinofuranosidase-like GH127 middle domain-containing protein n=1 Tax=Protea cynaroides TaxID=273540 RepID=A0A9Q0GSB3_9MAGN|nr:hypothetical protein NE237_027949 [Protea cynaroides]
MPPPTSTTPITTPPSATIPMPFMTSINAEVASSVPSAAIATKPLLVISPTTAVTRKMHLICDNNLQVKNTPEDLGGKSNITWDMLYKAMKNSDGSEFHQPGNLLKEIPLKYVRLDPESMHGQAQQITMEYLLMLDVDDLVWSYPNIPIVIGAQRGYKVTGIESFSKLGDFIYFEDENQTGLYIVQFISSKLDWKSGEIELNQQVQPVVSWEPFLYMKLSISTKQEPGKPSTLNLRIPHWSNSYTKAALNGQALQLLAAGNFLSITKKWRFGDEVTLQLPLMLTMDAIKDDRPKYASIQAILYGPYVLAGLTQDDWDLQIRKDGSISDLFSALPPTYNSHLISLSQSSANATFVLSSMNNSIAMQNLPESGTDNAVHATFRFVPLGGYSNKGNSISSSLMEAIGKSFILEPFDLPGFVVEQQEPNGELEVKDAENGPNSNNVFLLIAGLDGKNNTVSLELESQQGCFVSSGVNPTTAGSSIVLSCKPQNGSIDVGFQQATSFSMTKGLSEYHPISFMARGSRRNFLMMPLLKLKDESYTVYFNVTST